MPPVEKRRLGLIAAGALVLALAWQTPSARLEIRTHELGDLSPNKVEAALDLGVTALSLLVTWTAKG